MEDIAIFGAGGSGREIKSIIDAINKVNENSYNFLGFYDDGFAKGVIVNGFPILGGINDLNLIKKKLNLIISIANTDVKMYVISRINNNYINFPTIIHPNSSVSSESVFIGKGVVICESTIVNCNVKLGSFILINYMTTVGHDTIIGDYCSIMPGVNISGEVNMSESVYVGTGAKIVNLVNIGRNTIVGAGAVVSKSLPENCTAVGIPAKPIKFHKNK